MKRAFLFVPLLTVGLSAVLLLSCRKEQLRVIDDPADGPPAHCTNGVYDAGEQDIDCGGDCDPCTTLTPSCSPNNNSININSVGTFNYGTVYCDSTTNSWFEIRAYSPDIIIRISETPPNYEKVYYEGSPSLDVNAFEMDINMGFNSFSSASGAKIYVKRVNGKVQVTFCSLPISGSAGTSTASGKLTCN